MGRRAMMADRLIPVKRWPDALILSLPTSAKDLETMGFQPIGQSDGVTQGDHVSAVYLVDIDAETLACDPSLKIERNMRSVRRSVVRSW